MKTFFLLAPLLFINPSPKGPGHNLTPEDIKLVVDTHNEWRKQVKVPPLEWSDELAEVATKWGKELEKKCDWKHSGWQYGENLFKGTEGYYNAKDVVDSWGSEIEYYNYENNSCSNVCGHYTQMVWKTTTKVGCAKMTCDGWDVWICEYDPPGNYVGKKPY